MAPMTVERTAPRARRAARAALLLAFAWALGTASCLAVAPVDSGGCARDDSFDCDTSPDGGASNASGLVGYQCSGNARPDQHPRYVQRVPEGLICAEHGTAGDGQRRYCCTAETTSCAFNPVAVCDDPGTVGFQCRGADRPESLNPAVTCGQGVMQDPYINYCCTGAPQAPGCMQSDAVTCSPRMMGWTCTGSSLPKSQWLGPSKSKADAYYFLCSMPATAPNPLYQNYCCYTPALVPAGGSCVQDTKVSGCAPGRFGFACTDRDTPEDDFLQMHCPDPGVAGTSVEGYPAKLYCCDFQ